MVRAESVAADILIHVISGLGDIIPIGVVGANRARLRGAIQAVARSIISIRPSLTLFRLFLDNG